MRHFAFRLLQSPEVIASVVASGLQDALARDLSAAVSLRFVCGFLVLPLCVPDELVVALLTAFIHQLRPCNARTSTTRLHQACDAMQARTMRAFARTTPAAGTLAALVLVCRREALRAAMAATVPSAPTLDSMRWRVDVTISSSSLSKVLRPSLILEMTLSDGNIHTFEASVDTFHELRHTVAKLLVDMGGVESNPVLKIN